MTFDFGFGFDFGLASRSFCFLSWYQVFAFLMLHRGHKTPSNFDGSCGGCSSSGFVLPDGEGEGASCLEYAGLRVPLSSSTYGGNSSSSLASISFPLPISISNSISSESSVYDRVLGSDCASRKSSSSLCSRVCTGTGVDEHIAS